LRKEARAAKGVNQQRLAWLYGIANRLYEQPRHGVVRLLEKAGRSGAEIVQSPSVGGERRKRASA